MPRLANIASQALVGLGISRTRLFEFLYTLTNPNTGGGTSTADDFGNVVRITNNYIAISATAESSNSGYVYVYDSTGTLLWSLSNPNDETTGTNDTFGRRQIDISGNNLIVGASEEYVGSDQGAGVAYVYNLANGSLTYTLRNPNSYGTGAFDLFGKSVAIDGTYALVGAPSEDAFSNNTSGYAYAYTLSNGSLSSSIANPNTTFTQALDNFGSSIATNGTLWAIAAWGEDDPSNAAGVVHVYNTSGTRQRTIANPRTDSIALGQDNKMDIDGDNIIVASRSYAHIFDITDGSIQGTLGSLNGINNVSISGDYALVGWSDSNSNEFVNLYNWVTNTQIETITLGNITSFPGDQRRVSMNGNKLIIGDPANNQAFIYQLNI
jgi:hypothetical protein